MRRIVAASLLAIVLTGCSGDGTKGQLAPTSGTVRWKGKELEGAVVQFIPLGETTGGGGSARTGPDGKYSLQYVRGGEGVMPGEYKVVIYCRRMPDGSVVPLDYNVGDIDSQTKEILPRTYTDPEQTTLRASVSKGGPPIDFDLK